MSEKRCGTCRHWGDPDDTDRYRVCRAVEHDENGYAGSPPAPEWATAESLEERARFNAMKAVVCDGSGYYAALYARDDFGCVLHEPPNPPTS